jgi:3D (Asp-Asp-Asp) domain-containing protein
LEEVKKRVRYIDGVPDTSEDAVQTVGSEVITEPKSRVVIKGTALSAPYSPLDFPEVVLQNGRPAQYEKVIEGKATAYTAPAGSGTASGRKLQIGTVAVNPKVIPYGSLLYIVSKDGRHVYGTAVAADTGDFTDVQVDLYMGLTSEHYDDACRWGKKTVDVYVINTGKH